MFLSLYNTQSQKIPLMSELIGDATYKIKKIFLISYIPRFRNSSKVGGFLDTVWFSPDLKNALPTYLYCKSAQ
jgi:hypothetical protein